MNQCQLFCEFRCTHVKDNKQVGYASKTYHAFHTPDNHSNQKANVDVISINVMTFLTLRVKLLDSV